MKSERTRRMEKKTMKRRTEREKTRIRIKTRKNDDEGEKNEKKK